MSAVEPKHPIISSIFTADPSAHSFKGILYVYPSHDVDSGAEFNDKGDHYDMSDYHVLSMESPGAEVTDHGVALRVEDVPWASKQLWAPDCAEGPDGRYYLYFPARNHDGNFQIGVAVSPSPTGPFQPQPHPIRNSFSIDPCSFTDPITGRTHLYFGGLWGGQLQAWNSHTMTVNPVLDGVHEPKGPGVIALGPRMARLREDMLEFDEEVKEVLILDEDGRPLLADDHQRRFFEGVWVWYQHEKYFMCYSTGDTNLVVYASSDSPYGPFIFRGKMLDPPLGWTTHMSVVTHKGKDWFFYHDSELSGGKDHLRNVKFQEMKWVHNQIVPMMP